MFKNVNIYIVSEKSLINPYLANVTVLHEDMCVNLSFMFIFGETIQKY